MNQNETNLETLGDTSEYAKYRKLAKKHLRTMTITADARFEASKRLVLINSTCFLTTTIASLGLILIPLLDLAGINKIFSNITLGIVQIFLAVCVLVYSTAIGTANYLVRSKEYLQCGDRVKKIIDEFKVHLIDCELKKSKPNLEKYMNDYRKALEGFENHEDIDYQHALNVYNAKNSSEVEKEPDSEITGKDTDEETPQKAIKPKKAIKTKSSKNPITRFWSKVKPYLPFLIIGGFEFFIISLMILSYLYFQSRTFDSLLRIFIESSLQ
ncbi:SLATT domain-containing protein [Acinetobacter baumannii]|uniref:SLATT domain-containing protein n=1 Tax=Acinetobacter baumannii TaxID=470 RepID=UPI002A754E66|nr:SLATT domain-containing protein [Acinetobacter baumannii]WPQ53612.1 SLATT domain-containing protein [Acinetobacter baumannii]